MTNLRRTLRRVAAIAVVVILVLLAAGTATACPTCAEGMANDEAGQRLMSGYFWSILFMMGMPFLLLGSFSGYMYLEIRRARAKQDESDEVPSDTNDGLIERELQQTR